MRIKEEWCYDTSLSLHWPEVRAWLLAVLQFLSAGMALEVCGTRDCSRAAGFRKGCLSSHVCPPEVPAGATARPLRRWPHVPVGPSASLQGEEVTFSKHQSANARSQWDESEGAQKDTNAEEKMAQGRNSWSPDQSGGGTSDRIIYRRPRMRNLSFIHVVYTLIEPPCSNSYSIIGWCQNVHVKYDPGAPKTSRLKKREGEPSPCWSAPVSTGGK